MIRCKCEKCNKMLFNLKRLEAAHPTVAVVEIQCKNNKCKHLNRVSI